MRILVITSYGFNARMRNFIEFIVARLLAKNNWEVFALARPDMQKTESYVINGIKVFKTPYFLPGIMHIIKILFAKRPDIIHIFNPRNNRFGFAAAILAKIFRIPLVFTEYGLLHDHYLVSDRDNPFPISLKLRKDGPIFKFLKIFRDKNIIKNFKNYLFHCPMSRADKILFISKHNIEIAKILGFKNIIYLPHIFDDERWKTQDISTANKSEKLKILEKNKDKNLILFIGQIKLRKGWDVILETISYIDKNLNPELIFISPTEKETEEVSQKIDALKIRNKIIFLGKVEGEELKKIYEMSKLVVVPSRYEGFGLAVIEAWEMKKPVVASDVVAINEHVRDGYNGLLVPPENSKLLAQAIEKIIKDEKLCDDLIQGGNETLIKLKSVEARNQWINFYKDLMKKRP